MDYKSRDADLPRPSYGSSGRIESSSSLVKDRYSDRPAPDFRGASNRTDDRNGSSKRYMDQPTETRFSDRAPIPSANVWTGPSQQTFSINHNGGDIWAPKPADVPTWRHDDNRYDRFANNDRKQIVPTSQFVDSSVRNNQFLGGSNIIPGRFGGNNRYDNGRF
jgi:hypothetical protein